MAKQSGLGDNLYISGYNLSGDVGAVDTIAAKRALLDVTGINKSAHERVGGLRDGEISFTSFFNDAASQEHAALKGLPTTDVIVQYFRGTTLGNPAAGLIGKQVNYDWTRGQDGSLTGKVQVLGNGYALDWGKSLTAGVRTDTTGTNGTGVDFGTGSTTFGLAAYLNVVAFTGTSVTVTIQESSDNGGGDAFAAVTGGAFTAASAIGAQRIETSLTQTVERYLRAATTGTFSNAQFAVCVTRYDTAVG